MSGANARTEQVRWFTYMRLWVEDVELLLLVSHSTVLSTESETTRASSISIILIVSEDPNAVVIYPSPSSIKNNNTNECDIVTILLRGSESLPDSAHRSAPRR